MGKASVIFSADVVDIGLPVMTGNPELSWMVQFCCYINTSSLEVERCSFDVRGKRKIGQRTRMWAVISASGLNAGNDIRYWLDFRTLLKGPLA